MNRTRSKIVLLLSGLILLLPGLARASRDDYEAGQVIVTLLPGRSIDEVNATWGTTTLDAYAEGDLYLLDAAGLGDVELLAAHMESDPAILEAEANYAAETAEGVRQMVVVVVTGGFGDFEDQTIGSRIGLEEAHQRSRGAGVTVAILDTGLDPSHEAFAGRVSPDGYDFVAGDASPWEESNGVDDDLDGSVDEGYGHGTMVAGIVSLVAPDATLLPVRVLTDEGDGDVWPIAKGIRYAVIHGADVLNLSFGVPEDISTLGRQVSIARSLGAIIIAGAGNENQEQAYYPAGDSDAEMVTAVDSLDIKAGFADWDSKVLVSAPGTGVRAPFPDARWAIGNGCSFATPFVSGEAALIRSMAPSMPPDQVRTRLRGAVVDIDDLPGNDEYDDGLGSGRIYLPAALDGISSVPSSGGGLEVRLVVAPNPSAGDIHCAAPIPLGGFEGRVFDSAGRLVRVLERSDTPVWDGRREDFRPVASGIYFIRLTDGNREYTARVSILR